MRHTRSILLAWLLALVPCPGWADPVDDAFTQAVRVGPLGAGEGALAADASPKARFALGSIRMLRAVEGLSQGLYRYGMQTPVAALPLFRLPIRINPHPETIAYADFRAVIARFDADLGAAQAALEGVGEGDFRLKVDLSQVRLDLDGDGTATETEVLWTLMETTDPRLAAMRRLQREPQPRTIEPYPVTFDTGDAAWMLGYVHLLRGVADFWLAHDFSRQFEQTFHAFFPRSGLPLSNAPRVSAGILPADGASIADLVAFVHLFDWRVTDRSLLNESLGHLREVPVLSRRSWKLILAETDDEEEWLPNPRQTNRFPQLPVTQERIDAWMAAMDAFEAILTGRKLVPHWRFAKGINLRRALLEHERFDPVLWATGGGVTPFLEEGPVVSQQEWNAIVTVFRGNFLGYSTWFN